MKFPDFLTIAVVPKQSIIYLNRTADGEYKIVGGPEGKLIEIMSQALKFSYKLFPTPDGVWGNLENGKWSGGIGMVYRGETDIGLSKFGVSELRSLYIDYSYPYSVEDLTFATRKPGLRSPIDSLIHPFTSNLWVSVITTLVVMSVLFSLFFQTSFGKAVERVFGILMHQSFKEKKWDIKKKFIVSSWLWGALLLSYSYVAVLLSFLTVPLLEQGVENVQQLSEAVAAGTFKAMTYRGAMQLPDLLDSKRKSVQIIAKDIKDNDRLIEPDRELIVNALLKERIAMISPKNTLIFFVQNQFFVSQDTFKFHPSAILMSKTFCCRSQVDTFVHRVVASGIYQKFIDDDIFKSALVTKAFESSDSDASLNSAKPLKILDLSGAFIVLVMGYILALIAVISERVYFKFCQRENI